MQLATVSFLPFARVPMRNAPPGTRCAHEDGRKGCESMRPGSGQGGLSTEETKKPKRPKKTGSLFERFVRACRRKWKIKRSSTIHNPSRPDQE
ncbi:hypothetical protein N7471_011943 [Penicillium samsonianum]|uniref:uncharacterized protein n=1 Tax=Penicillium samsonianum TaxID=1882272 RepID=UPI00254837DF|nr:uncharacterized protein N7471_011943 [Penicillium samsonianum]KAJ6124626.1 hypothetical protein N7471_011943 [Penicillium samsonianum]